MKNHTSTVRACARAAALTSALVLTVLPQAWASDAKAGKRLAVQCAMCHGPVGLSVLPSAPHIAGQPAFYLEEQLRLYRSGKRTNEIMSVIAKPLTDAEIENLSAWYASIRIEVVSPE